MQVIHSLGLRLSFLFRYRPMRSTPVDAFEGRAPPQVRHSFPHLPSSNRTFDRRLCSRFHRLDGLRLGNDCNSADTPPAGLPFLVEHRAGGNLFLRRGPFRCQWSVIGTSSASASRRIIDECAQFSSKQFMALVRNSSSNMWSGPDCSQRPIQRWVWNNLHHLICAAGQMDM